MQLSRPCATKVIFGDPCQKMSPKGVISGDHRQEMTPIGVIFGDHRQKMTLIGVILSGPEMTRREQMTRLSMAESFRTGGKKQKSFQSHLKVISVKSMGRGKKPQANNSGDRSASAEYHGGVQCAEPRQHRVGLCEVGQR